MFGSFGEYYATDIHNDSAAVPNIARSSQFHAPVNRSNVPTLSPSVSLDPHHGYSNWIVNDIRIFRRAYIRCTVTDTIIMLLQHFADALTHV